MFRQLGDLWGFNRLNTGMGVLFLQQGDLARARAALEQLLHSRTSFVVAHCLSTIKHADQILVINDGEIIERGKFNELLDKKGFFYDLYMSQFRRQEPVSHPLSGNGQKADGGMRVTTPMV